MSEISGGSSEYPSTRSFTSQTSEDDPVRTGLDLVSAARRNLRFLRYVADSDWFRNSFSLLHAIRRYEELWMPLICDLTIEGHPHPPMILPPIDVEWVWYCHSLNPVEYRRYCERKFSKLIGKAAIFDEENEDYAVNKCREIWRKRYPNEPFENEFSDSDDQSSSSYGGMKESSNDLAEESEREVIMREMGKQKDVYERYFKEPYMGEIMYLIAAKRRYKKMLQMVMGQLQDHQGPPISIFIPTVDILLMWLTHQSYPTVYAADTKNMEDDMLIKVVGPWDSSVKEKDIGETKRLWEATFDQPYEKAGGGIATGLGGGNDHQLFCWAVSDSDVNIKYKSLRPRHLLEVCVFVRLDSQKDATLAEKTREFLRLQMLRSHKELKLDKPIFSFPTDTWLKAWHLYCEFGTKGIMLELRHSGSLCFTGTGLLDGASVMWNELLRAPSLAIGREIDQKIRSFTSITPPVQAPYLLKCVPDRVTDDSGAMISDVMLKLNHYRPQEGRWLSRTVLDHSGRECFVVRIRVGEGFWRRGGESPETVRWEDRIIEVREGSWSYVDNSAIGRAPDKVVGTAKPKEEAKEGRTAWSFSTGDELAIQWESTSSLATLSFTLDNQDPDSSVMLLKGRKMQYQMTEQEKKLRHKTDHHEAEDEEEGFVTLVRFSEDNPNGKATALLNWKLLAAEILPEEDAVFVLLLCFAILRTVSEMKKEDVGGLLIRRRLKETKHGLRDWGSVILHPSSYPCSSAPSPHVQPWYWNPKGVLARDHGAEPAVSPPVLGSSLAEGGDKLYKKGIIT